MKKIAGLLLLFFCLPLQAQLQYEPFITLGTITGASELRGALILKNTGPATLFLLRADADRGVKIYTSKKTLNAGDTALLSIWFVPEKAGRFEKKISLVTSHRPDPSLITLSGNLQKFKPDDRTACFYFGEKRSPTVVQTPTLIAIPAPATKPDISNKLPEPKDNKPADPPSQTVTLSPPLREKPILKKDTTALPLAEYKPNNLIFLVDVSGSMKDSVKLPLMKLALHTLINQLREVDKITFITYADTIKILAEGADANSATELHELVDRLKAKGMTKGRKAILFSQQAAQKHFIPEGNNQIIIATDGQFRFEKEDQKLWNERQGVKPIIISTLAFGDDKEAIRNLKTLARKGKGNFVQILNRQERQKLLEEIRQQSRREQR